MHRRTAIQIGRDAIVRAYQAFDLNPLQLERLSFNVQWVSESVTFWISLLHVGDLLPNDETPIIIGRHAPTVHVSGKLIPQLQ